MTCAMIRKATIKSLMVMCIFVFATAYAQPKLSFDDVPQDHWAADSVESLRSVGMLEGFPDGAYYGNLALSRYQMAVLLDRMLTLARQEAQSEGLSISEISALQQQIDQLNAILSQSVQSLIGPDASLLNNDFSNNRTTLSVPFEEQVEVQGVGVPTTETTGTMSRSGLVTPTQADQSNYYQVQQNQAESFTTANTTNTQATVSNNARQIIATYEATPSAIEYQQYLDAYMAVYGSSESGATNVQQINKVGVLPGDAGAASPLVTNALGINSALSDFATGQNQQYAQQFAEQYQLQAQQPQLQQAANQQSSQSQPIQSQPLSFAGNVGATVNQAQNTNQVATNQQPLLADNVAETQIVRSNGVYLQLGAFANALSAESLGSELADLGFNAMQQDQAGLYKVLVGPFDFVTVQRASETLTAQGYSFFMVR